MDRELWVFITGIGAARLAPYLLAEAIGINELVGPDRHGIEAIEQAQIGKLLDGVGQRVDAHPELTDGVGLLVELAFDIPRMQHQGGGEPPNAAPDDNGLHADTHSTTAPPPHNDAPACASATALRVGRILLETYGKIPKTGRSLLIERTAA